jgi:hypothetical protein
VAAALSGAPEGVDEGVIVENPCYLRPDEGAPSAETRHSYPAQGLPHPRLDVTVLP